MNLQLEEEQLSHRVIFNKGINQTYNDKIVKYYIQFIIFNLGPANINLLMKNAE